MWQSGEKSHQHWWDEFTSIPLPFFFQIQSQSLLLCTWHISWYLHSCWKPIAHPRVQENAQNIVNVLFLKYCSISLNHLFLVMALWGSSIFVTVGLGHISNTQPAWSVCVSPDSFTFHRVEIASEEFICQLHPGEGKMCLQESQWASTWALLGGYDGPTHPRGRWCYSALGEWPQMVGALRCWLAADFPSLLPLPLSEMAGWPARACPAMACAPGQQCLYSRNVCALFCVDPVKERDQDVLPNFPDEAVLAIELIAHTTVNSVWNVL